MSVKANRHHQKAMLTESPLETLHISWTYTPFAKPILDSLFRLLRCLLEQQTSRLSGSFSTDQTTILTIHALSKNTTICLSTCLQELQTSLLTGKVLSAC